MKKSDLKREVEKFFDVRKIVEHGKYNYAWHVILENDEQFVLQYTIRGWLTHSIGKDRAIGLHNVLQYIKSKFIREGKCGN